jgi:hypothetical protein
LEKIRCLLESRSPLFRETKSSRSIVAARHRRPRDDDASKVCRPWINNACAGSQSPRRRRKLSNDKRQCHSGQDLLFLKDWLEEHPEAKPINLVYFGYFDPRHAGVEYAVPEHVFARREGPLPLEEIAPGWYAVSVNFVRGYPWFVYKPDGTKVGLPLKALTVFQQLKPVAMAGYSIYIYNVEPRVESLEPEVMRQKNEGAER